LAKKGHDITPLNENEYTSIEVNGFSSGDEFTDGFNGFSENTPGGNPHYEEVPIQVFSFDSSSENNNHSTDINLESVHNSDISQDNNPTINNKINSIVPQSSSASQVQKIRGLTPKINGEAFDVKRCYQFRASTIKKLNQLKGESDDINIYLNEIIDAAICFYHDSVFAAHSKK